MPELCRSGFACANDPGPAYPLTLQALLARISDLAPRTVPVYPSTRRNAAVSSHRSHRRAARRPASVWCRALNALFRVVRRAAAPRPGSYHGLASNDWCDRFAANGSHSSWCDRWSTLADSRGSVALLRLVELGANGREARFPGTGMECCASTDGGPGRSCCGRSASEPIRPASAPALELVVVCPEHA